MKNKDKVNRHFYTLYLSQQNSLTIVVTLKKSSKTSVLEDTLFKNKIIEARMCFEF